MKKYLVLLSFFSSVILSTQAQETSWVYESNMQDSSEHYVFGDTVFVRSAASLQSAVLDTLFAGHEVLLVKKTDVSAIVRGFSAPWGNVKYKKNGTDRTGYIWTGLLSFDPMRRGTTKFIFGFERRWKEKTNENEQYYYTGVLKVVEKGKPVCRTGYQLPDGESLSFIGGSVLPAGGLDSVNFIIGMTYSGEACGIPTYTYLYAWNGNRLIEMPLLTNIGDADVFWHTEDFILPKQKGGQPGTLIIDIETAEQTEKTDKKGAYLYSFEGEKKYYNWNGRTFKLLKTVPKKKQLKTYLP